MTQRPDVEVVGGGPATPEEVAALTAAIEVVLRDTPPDSGPPVSPWRWSGRRWGNRADPWRRRTPSA